MMAYEYQLSLPLKEMKHGPRFPILSKKWAVSKHCNLLSQNFYYSNKPFNSRLWLNVWGPTEITVYETETRETFPPVHLYIIAGQRREMPPICTLLRMRKKRRISFNSGGRTEGRKEGNSLN